MPIYESETLSREDLEKKRKHNVCAVCQSWLNMFLDRDTGKVYLACNADQTHEGISREASRYEQQGMEALTIKARREAMEKTIGKEKTTSLARYHGVTSLTEQNAMEIMEVIWPEAPLVDKKAAAMLCASYGLNPLAGHVFLIKFKKYKDGKVIGEDWARVIGIKANRLIASRRGTFSYIDDTPRLMTEEEQLRRFGETYDDRITAIVKLQDPATGAEAVGYGHWLRKETPYGIEKGNTKFNMAAIRAERQALDRLRPGEMPSVEVVDEAFINADYTVTEEPKADKPIPFIGTKEAEPAQPEPLPSAVTSTAKAVKPVESTEPSASGIPSTTEALLAWVCEVKAFRMAKTAHAWLLDTCKIAEDRIVSDPTGVYNEVKEII